MVNPFYWVTIPNVALKHAVLSNCSCHGMFSTTGVCARVMSMLSPKLRSSSDVCRRGLYIDEMPSLEVRSDSTNDTFWGVTYLASTYDKSVMTLWWWVSVPPLASWKGQTLRCLGFLATAPGACLDTKCIGTILGNTTISWANLRLEDMSLFHARLCVYVLCSNRS